MNRAIYRGSIARTALDVVGEVKRSAEHRHWAFPQRRTHPSRPISVPFPYISLSYCSSSQAYSLISLSSVFSPLANAASMTRYDPDQWIEQLMRCEHLPESDMKVLCDRVRALLMEESNIQPVASPVTICGDIHGQFWDLLELLRKGGRVPETSYIFMARTCSLSCLGSSNEFFSGGILCGCPACNSSGRCRHIG